MAPTQLYCMMQSRDHASPGKGNRFAVDGIYPDYSYERVESNRRAQGTR